MRYRLGRQGRQVLTVEFTVCGIPCLGLNDGEVVKRAFEAMMEMGKIDVARIEAAIRGEA